MAHGGGEFIGREGAAGDVVRYGHLCGVAAVGKGRVITGRRRERGVGCSGRRVGSGGRGGRRLRRRMGRYFGAFFPPTFGFACFGVARGTWTRCGGLLRDFGVCWPRAYRRVELWTRGHPCSSINLTWPIGSGSRAWAGGTRKGAFTLWKGTGSALAALVQAGTGPPGR